MQHLEGGPNAEGVRAWYGIQAHRDGQETVSSHENHCMRDNAEGKETLREARHWRRTAEYAKRRGARDGL